MTEPGPLLEPLLKRLPVLLVGRIFNGDGVVTLANFTALLALTSRKPHTHDHFAVTIYVLVIEV
jgi:hypothetical protein